MKPIALPLLAFILGLGIWIIVTGSQDIFSIFTSSPNSNEEIVINGNYMESSPSDDAKSSNDEDITNTEVTNDDTDKESNDEALLLAENSTSEVSKENIVISNVESEESPLSEADVEEVNDEAISEENVAVAEATMTEEPETNEVLDEKVNDEAIAEEDTTVAEATITQETENNTDSIELASETPTQATMPMANPNMSNMWMPSMQYPMNYYNWMNPMFYMMGPMMSMMGSMMNPAIYMNPWTTMNYPVTAMTQPHNLDAMMRAMDPQLMFGMFGQPSAAYKEGEVPDQLPVVTIPGFPTQLYQNWPKNMPSEPISREAKLKTFQTAMAMSPLSMRNMVSMMADKIPVAEDVSWDDAVEAMKLRANEVNFKFVGSSPLWKQIEAETEQPSTKVEIFRFCDARVARKILDEVPEFIVFLPCRIALLEDADGKLWVMTLDWDVSWLDYAQNPNTHLPKDLREDAERVRESIAYIMEGAATGDF